MVVFFGGRVGVKKKENFPSSPWDLSKSFRWWGMFAVASKELVIEFLGGGIFQMEK